MDQLIINGSSIKTLVAITEDDHQQGLMGRSWPPPIMSFPYKTAKIRKFWMKNTISPLDIIFCRSGKIIEIVAGEPLSERHIGPDQASDLVIEMPFGMAKAISIKAGQDVLLKCSIITIASIYNYCLLKNAAQATRPI